jgi:hypothetical protein
LICIDYLNTFKTVFNLNPVWINNKNNRKINAAKAQVPGHGDLEEAALNLSNDPGLVDQELYERLGKDNIGKAGDGPGFAMMPAWAIQRLSEEGMGYLNFDLEKA